MLGSSLALTRLAGSKRPQPPHGFAYVYVPVAGRNLLVTVTLAGVPHAIFAEAAP